MNVMVLTIASSATNALRLTVNAKPAATIVLPVAQTTIGSAPTAVTVQKSMVPMWYAEIAVLAQIVPKYALFAAVSVSNALNLKNGSTAVNAVNALRAAHLCIVPIATFAKTAPKYAPNVGNIVLTVR